VELLGLVTDWEVLKVLMLGLVLGVASCDLLLIWLLLTRWSMG